MIATGVQFYGRTFGSAYRSILQKMLQPDVRVNDRAMFSEIIGAQVFVTDPSSNLILSRRRKLNFIYGLVESIWNLTRTDEIEVLERFNSRIRNYVADQSDSDYVRWAYGHALNFQMFRVIAELKRDLHSRRAAMANMTLNPAGTVNDGTPPCLVSVQFIVRDGGLYQIVNMRSNDVWFGFPTDVAQFSFWGQLAAGALGIPFKGYIHNVGSLHLYHGQVNDAMDVVRFEPVIDAAQTPLPMDCNVALDEILEGRAYQAIKQEDPSLVALQGMRPIINAMLGYRDQAPSELNDIANKGYGIGWPQVRASIRLPSTS